MKTIKAGCFLVNREMGKIALIYREKQKDYSFPKGHLEKDEDLETCALRETAEETKRDGQIVKEFSPYVENYTTPSGEECVCYMFIAIDKGKSDNKSTDTHQLHWTSFEDVEEKLSYKSLKEMWTCVKDNVLKVLTSIDAGQ